MFIDMDAYFASVEQMDRPELKGRAVAVTPIDAPTGCCIATSYEARRHGVKTGCMVRDARVKCPGITIVKARPDRYIEVHHKVLDAIESAVHVTEVESIDECRCQLLSNEQPRDAAAVIAGRVKLAMWKRVGSVTCSIGVGPNRLIAKVAAGMNKPDGLTIVERGTLPGAIEHLELTDLPGISRGISRRLRAHNITTVAELCRRSEADLRTAWGSVLGSYWWHWLRGDQVDTPRTHRRTISHQHVLAPEFRSAEHAPGVSLRLLSKAAQRMRSLNYVASRISLTVIPVNGRAWSDWTAISATDDTIELHRHLRNLWGVAPKGNSLQLGVRLEGLTPKDQDLPLFAGERGNRDLMAAIDAINQRSGADTIYLGAMHHERKSAPRRIPFGSPPDLALPDSDGQGWPASSTPPKAS